MKRVIGYAAALLLIGAAAVRADGAVWVAEKAGERVLLGGTVHVLRPSDYPLPKVFARAYAAADRVFLETNVKGLESPAAAGELQARMALPPGTTLRDVLSTEAYDALRSFAAARGVSLAGLEGLKPSMVLLSFMGQELHRIGAAAEGVDAHFLERARADRKPVGELEPLGRQLDLLAAMGEGRESAFVLYSLRDLERSEALLDELVAAWRRGDTDTLQRLYVMEMKRDFPGLYRNLLVGRNRDWLPRIEALFREPGTELVLVGAAHLVGEDGLLALLERRGYTVRRFQAGAEIPPTPALSASGEGD